MPPSSATIVGRAGATRVRLSEAMSDPSIRPAKTARTARSPPFFSGAAVASRAATAVLRRRSPLAVGDGAPPRRGLALPGAAPAETPGTTVAPGEAEASGAPL